MNFHESLYNITNSVRDGDLDEAEVKHTIERDDGIETLKITVRRYFRVNDVHDAEVDFEGD